MLMSVYPSVYLAQVCQKLSNSTLSCSDLKFLLAFSPQKESDIRSLKGPRLFAIQFNSIVIFCLHHKKFKEATSIQPKAISFNFTIRKIFLGRQ